MKIQEISPGLLFDYRKDKEQRKKFYDFTRKVFPRAEFRKWGALGWWNEKYIPWSYTLEGRIVSNVSVSEMTLLIRGERARGLQFATVGTLPEYRMKGLSASLMHRVLEEYEHKTDLFFLFGNESVLDFYPRFGFRRVHEHLFSADVRFISVSSKARPINLADPADLKLLSRLAHNRRPVSRLFGAIDYGHAFLFHVLNGLEGKLWYLEDRDLLAAFTLDGDTLRLYDLLSPSEFSLKEVLPEILPRPVSRIVFYFTPDQRDIGVKPLEVYGDSPLFVRGDFPLDSVHYKFPVLAQT